MRYLLKYDLLIEAKKRDYDALYLIIKPKFDKIVESIDMEEILNIENILRDNVKNLVSRETDTEFALMNIKTKRFSGYVLYLPREGEEDLEGDEEYFCEDWKMFSKDVLSKYLTHDVYFNINFSYNFEGHLPNFSEEIDEIKDRCDDMGILFEMKSSEAYNGSNGWLNLKFSLKIDKEQFLDDGLKNSDKMSRLNTFMDRKNITGSDREELINIVKSRR